MATRRSKLLPDLEQPAPAARPKRVPLVHVIPTEEGWAVRIGRRIETTRSDREAAVEVALPLARERSAKLFLHLQDGRIRQISTDVEDEMFYKLWKRINEQHNPQAE